MQILIVVNNPKDWSLKIPGVKAVAARAYLTDPGYSELRDVRVFNLSRSYRYQSLGYYVSLLAEARGHKPLPSISTIQDMKSQTITRFVSDDLDDLIQKSLAPIQSHEFVLSIYFGRNLAKRYDRLSLNLFNLFPTPLLRARFVRAKDDWQLQSIGPIAASDIPDDHHLFVVGAATEHFAGKRARGRKRTMPRYDLAILYNPKEENAPSDARALKRFAKAAESIGLGVELVTRDDYGRLAEFDALFIRETTGVNHHTFRFSRRAVAEGLVTIDDPDSILKCTNKVYLAELLAHHRVRTPRTRIVNRENLDDVSREMGMPCILKQPDSSFSQGIGKVESEQEFRDEAEALLERSELIIAQEFLPTPFDWRVGILAGKPLYVCKYFMVRRHWQIIHRDPTGRKHEGKAETFPIDAVPQKVVSTALRAANLIGDGLYGVDLKQVDDKVYVIEVNDNPSIDAGIEDAVLGVELYREIMQVFLERIEERKGGGQTH